jgi:hypothetical protein
MPEGQLPDDAKAKREERRRRVLAGLKTLSPAQREQAQALADYLKCERYVDIPAALEGLNAAAAFFDPHDPTALPTYFRQTEAELLLSADAEEADEESSGYSRVYTIMAEAFGAEAQTRIAELTQRLERIRQALRTTQEFFVQEEPRGFLPSDIRTRNAYEAQGYAAAEALRVVIGEAHDVQAYFNQLTALIHRKLEESAENRPPDSQAQVEAVIKAAQNVLGLEGFEQRKREMLIDMPFVQTLGTLRTASTQVPQIVRGIGDLACQLHEQLNKQFPAIHPT